MLVYESEALRKWCPFTRCLVSIEVDAKNPERLMEKKPIAIASFNRGQDASVHGLCIGSRCMQWRWGEDDDSGERRGYCGLGGKP